MGLPAMGVQACRLDCPAVRYVWRSEFRLTPVSFGHHLEEQVSCGLLGIQMATQARRQMSPSPPGLAPPVFLALVSSGQQGAGRL